MPPAIFEWFVDDMESIVAWIRASASKRSEASLVLEICCGNSALPLALAAHHGTVVAIDWSPAVVEEMRPAASAQCPLQKH